MVPQGLSLGPNLFFIFSICPALLPVQRLLCFLNLTAIRLLMWNAIFKVGVGFGCALCMVHM